MEELLLGLLLTGDELHVVHQQQCRLAVFLPEFGVFPSRIEATSSLVKSSPLMYTTLASG